MTDKTKNVNYTEEMTANLVNAYENADNEPARLAVVNEYAELYGKSAASIRAKLVREGVYVAKTRAPAGKAGVKKADLVAAIADLLGVNSETVESLEKATKRSLELVRNALETEEVSE